MHNLYSKWERSRHRHHQARRRGLASAVLLIRENSAPNAVQKDRRRGGYAAAVLLIQAGSVRSAERKDRKGAILWQIF